MGSSSSKPEVATAMPTEDAHVGCKSVKGVAQQHDPQQECGNAEQSPELDLCFLCDCTGSMGEYIAAAQQNIRSIVERVALSEKASVRFALISYRDHPPQDSTYVTRVFNFTTDVAEMKGYVDSMSAQGGGDGPEAVTAALHDALRMPWRTAAAKVAILIADAPPHGLEPHGDGFPDGDPQGRDPLEIARQMAARNITCYSVGCEPALGSFRFARDFMCTIAEITGGQAVALSSAALLADVIIHGSAEEISMTRLQREVEQELEHVQQAARENRETIDESECAHRAWTNLQSRNVVSKQMHTDGAMKNAHTSIWHKSADSAPQSLASAKAELCATEGIPASSEPEIACAGFSLSGGSRSSRTSLRMFKPWSIASKEVDEAMPRRSSRSGGRMFIPSSMATEEAEAMPRSVASPMFSGSAMAATSCVATEDVITEDQVSRIMKRATYRSKA